MDNQKHIDLSIIIPTIGRRKELDDLLNSIKRNYIDYLYELIIVDQNVKGYINEIVKKYENDFIISHYNVNFKGLSKAKNFGVSKAKGIFVSFPDDDCLILGDTYNIGLNAIINLDLDIVFGKCIDEKGDDSVLKFKKSSYYLNYDNMLGGFVEATAIVKKNVFEKGYLFDENMGAGCFHGAEEGFDWLYRILQSGSFNVFYDPKILFYHPQVIMEKGDFNSLNRVFSYRCGTAYLCKKHKFYFKYYRRIILSIAASLYYLTTNRNKFKYYFVEFCALITGWILYEKRNNV
jgi:glycosyltransferase involved in cell wall biosynthesis